MEQLRETFEERLAEVEAYLDFLNMMQSSMQNGLPRFEGAAHAISTQQQKILFSSVYLQLYNLVESTMTGCIDLIGTAASRDSAWRPHDLNQTVLREWIRLTARTHVDLTPENRLECALDLCNRLVSSLPLTDFSIEKGGGGNWDDNEIEAIARRLGFRIQVSRGVYNGVKRPFRDDLGPLGLVKQLRNRLAHGSISFTECAEYETVARLNELKNKTVDYLIEVIACFCGYVERHEFLIPERRPA